MTKKQQSYCIANIQDYLDRIEWLENRTGLYSVTDNKRCKLCDVFIPNFDVVSYCDKSGCRKCPLGPKYQHCTKQRNYIDYDVWEYATVPELRKRMNWLLKRYKQASLEIEIIEE